MITCIPNLASLTSIYGDAVAKASHAQESICIRGWAGQGVGTVLPPDGRCTSLLSILKVWGSQSSQVSNFCRAGVEHSLRLLLSPLGLFP